MTGSHTSADRLARAREKREPVFHPGTRQGSARGRGFFRLRAGAAAVALCFALGSCASYDINDFDTAGGITKNDWESMLGRKKAVEEAQADAGAEPPIPDFQSVLAAPAAPELADTRRVSLAVTETTPVRDVLIELARRAGVDLEMDPRISGGIIMSVNDRPFIDVVERIADLAELRYRMERNVLRVEVDDPYLEQYRMDVLNVSRSSASEISSSADASAAAQAVGTSSGGGGNNSSSMSISSTSTADFWGNLGNNISNILNNITSRRPRVQESINAAFVPESGQTPTSAPSERGADGLVDQAASMTQGRQAQADAILDQDQSQPDLAAAANEGGAAATQVASSSYSINPMAGIVTVFANQRQHTAVEKYLRAVRASVTQQVLIEAKILEVVLDDQFRSGIDWRAALGPNDDFQITTNFNRSVVPPDFTDPTMSFLWSNSDGDLSASAQLVRQFGTVRTLSNPRVTVVNNQTAILKIARNQVFFQIQVQEQEGTATQAAKTTVTSNIKTVPVGLVMSVQPAVDHSSGRISLGLRPSITRITGFVEDPGVAIVVAQSDTGTNVSSPIPIVEVREMDSVVTMESGQTVVMGGLMQEEATTTREGLPGVMDVPILGQAVSQNIRQNKVTELVIFLRATLVNDRDTVSDEDIRLYRTFAPDPRPIVF